MVAGSRDVLSKRALVGDAADGLAFGIVLGERGALAPERARSLALHAALDRRRPGAEDLAQLGDGRVGDGAQRLVAGRVQLALGDRTDARKRAHRQRRQHRALDAGRDQHHAARLGQRGRHLRHHLAGRDARARGQPQLSVDRAGELEDRALDRGVAALVTGAAVETLAAREVEEHLVDAGHQHGRRVAPRDLADAVRVRAVGVAAGRQVDRVGRQLARLDQRHPRLHAQPAHLVAGRRHHAAGAGLAAHDDRLALQRGIEDALDGDEERVEIQAADPRLRARPRPRDLRRRRHERTVPWLLICSVQAFASHANASDTLQRAATSASDHEDRHLERELAGRPARQGGVVAGTRAARHPADAGDEAGRRGRAPATNSPAWVTSWPITVRAAGTGSRSPAATA